MCKTLGTYLCFQCSAELEAIDFQRCLVCDQLSIQGKTHKFCQSTVTPYSTTSSFEYTNITKKIINNAKTGKNSYKLLKTLTTHPHTNSLLIKHASEIDYIVPIPSTRKLFSSRLINHSVIIAEQVRFQINKPIIDILEKTSSQDQKSKTRKGRLSNLGKTIKLKDGKNKHINIENKAILLVDDLATTGATLMTASKTLYTQNPKKVLCYTLCKDLRYNSIARSWH